MEKQQAFTPNQNPLSPKMMEWLRLRRALEDSITDPDLLRLFHDFMSVDLELCAEELQKACRRDQTSSERT